MHTAVHNTARKITTHNMTDSLWYASADAGDHIPDRLL